jgi:rhodanese-related sulfurtransferase
MDRLLDYSINNPLLAGGFVLMTLIVIGYEIRHRLVMASAIAPTEAIRLVNNGAVLVDLRAANQFKDGHIAGARNLPADQIAADPQALARFAGKPVVLYCGDGVVTAAAQRTLARAGAKEVFALRGGLAAWSQENLPVVKG